MNSRDLKEERFLGKTAHDSFYSQLNRKEVFEKKSKSIQDGWIKVGLDIKTMSLSTLLGGLIADGDTEKSMNEIAKFLGIILQGLGFALFTFEFNKSGPSNYISNAQREDMIKFLKETLVRFENQEIVNKIQNFKK